MEAVLSRQREDTGQHQAVLEALRDLRGRATVGDVVAATSLDRDQAEQSLRELLESRRGHLAVGEGGDLVYEFDPKLIRRGAVSGWTRFRRAARQLFIRAFKVWIVVMLVVYFIVFVALAVAAIIAVLSRGGSDNRGSRGRGFRMPSAWIWYLFWSPNWGRGRPYYGHRWERNLGPKQTVPFYKKVFAFVFGPDEPRPTREQRDRSTLRLIRARRGVLTHAELIEHTGLPVVEAREEMARLVGAYAGDVRVSREGELVYIFPELMVSAHGRVSAREPDPAWRRLEYPKTLTGNTKRTDAIIAGLNGFNLLAAASAPWLIFPQLGIGGTAGYVGLVAIPLVFSLLFFAVPLLRAARVARENAARAARNIRKVLLGFVYRASLTGDGITAPDAAVHVGRTLKRATMAPGAVEGELQRLAAEWDAEIQPDPSGSIEFRFPEIRQQFGAAEEMRRALALEEKTVGAIVYSSGDSPEEAGRRELAAFDRELNKYVPAPEEVGYVDDFEMIEFDEELARMRAIERGR